MKTTKSIGAFIVLIVIFVIFAVASGDFRNPDNLLNIARQLSYSGLIALGMTLVISGGGIDLSVGSLLAFSGVFGLSLSALFPELSPVAKMWLFFAGALLAGAFGGACNGVLVNWGNIPPFIATLGTMSIFRSLATYKANAGLIMAENSALTDFCSGITPPIFLLGGAVVLSLLLGKTLFGRHLCAAGSNEKVAIFSAVNVKLTRFYSYLTIGVLCGIAAFLLAGRLNSISSTNSGASYELDAIAAVIIGGTPMTGGKASVWGTLAGVFILGIISNMLDMWSISVNLQGTVKGIVIILAVLFQYRKENR